jgi:putative oxidoreductase
MNKFLPGLKALDGVYEKMRSALGHPLLFLIRLYWGYQFAVTGWGKLNNLERVGAWFGSLGIPFPEANAFLVGSFELIGGIILIVGFGRGYFSLPLVAIMSVAYLTDDIDALTSVFSDPDAFVDALPFTYILANLLVIAFGPGKLSLDGFLEWRKRSRNGQESEGVAASPA